MIASYIEEITIEYLVSSFTRLLLRGYKKPLEFEDLYDLPSDDKTMILYPKFEKQWNKAQTL